MSTKTNHSVSKELAKKVTAEIDAAVQAILQKHGLSSEQVSTKFGDLYQYTIKASAVELVNGVNVESIHAKDWIVNAWEFGFSQEQAKKHLGQEIPGKLISGQKVYLAGFAPRKQKTPFIGMTEDGRMWQITRDVVQRLAGYKPHGMEYIVRDWVAPK
jgi:hypothetical protein